MNENQGLRPVQGMPGIKLATPHQTTPQLAALQL